MTAHRSAETLSSRRFSVGLARAGDPTNRRRAPPQHLRALVDLNYFLLGVKLE